MYGLIELVLVFGGALAFGVYELWSLRRYKARQKADAAGSGSGSGSGKDHDGRRGIR